jgi:hypothetical protein
MNVDYVSIGRNPPEGINAIIEVPIGGEPIKYEMDKKAGTLVVDRFLYRPIRYPGNYGFIRHTPRLIQHTFVSATGFGRRIFIRRCTLLCRAIYVVALE